MHQLRNQLHSQALNDKKDSAGNEQQEVTLFQRKATTITALLVQQNFESVLLSEPCLMGVGFAVQQHLTLAWHWLQGSDSRTKVPQSSCESGPLRRKALHSSQQLQLPNRAHDPFLFENKTTYILLRYCRKTVPAVCNFQQHLPSRLCMLEIFAHAHTRTHTHAYQWGIKQRQKVFLKPGTKSAADVNSSTDTVVALLIDINWATSYWFFPDTTERETFI